MANKCIAAPTQFGNALLKARIFRGMKQGELARKSARSPQHICILEKGYCSETYKSMMDLAEALDCRLHISFQPKETPSLEEQVSQLADFILTQCAGYPNKNEGAIQTAIQIITDMMKIISQQTVPISTDTAIPEPTNPQQQ